MNGKTFAVILSGCGHQDGAEIHEATMTLWAIHKAGCEYRCFAPDIPQRHVLNHITGNELPEQRNVLIESARIARGQIADLADFSPENIDGLVIPGGFGAAKNLCSYAFDGAECTVNKDVADAVLAMHEAAKPIGALCIAPVILARLLEQPKLTIGDNADVAQHIEEMGGTHIITRPEEIVIDSSQNIVTTACYMFDARVDQIARSADKVIQAMLELM